MNTNLFFLCFKIINTITAFPRNKNAIIKEGMITSKNKHKKQV